jgi:hypothetical protein
MPLSKKIRYLLIDTVASGLGLELHREVATLPVYTVEQIQRPSPH